MKRSFQEALENRRSIYSLMENSPVSDDDIRGIVEFAVKYIPSAFNSQSTRIVLLFGDSHRRLWDIVKEEIRKIITPEAFSGTEAKIDRCFKAGHGTVLFFEDNTVIEQLQKDYPLYSMNFPVWAQHTSAMHQLTVWTMLEDVGLGASLQHYNPLIDEAVHEEWKIDPKWELVAEMPFGTPMNEADEKRYLPISNRVLTFV